MQVLKALKRCFYLTSPGRPPPTKQCHLPSLSNLANRENRENPAHFLLLATTGLARDRPSPYGPWEGFARSRNGRELVLSLYRVGCSSECVGLSPALVAWRRTGPHSTVQGIATTNVFYVSAHAYASVSTHHSPAMQPQAPQAQPADETASKR